MSHKKRIIWHCLWITATLLVILTLTPLITPSGVHTPMVLGIPRTLWSGILVAIALVALTWGAAVIHPENPEDRP